MSDGPYRTLPMISACKRWAKRAHHSAYDRQDIADAVGPALAAHWTAGVSKELLSALWSICDPRQTVLFDDGYAAKLDALHGTFAGQGILSNILIDCVEQTLAGGKSAARLSMMQHTRLCLTKLRGIFARPKNIISANPRREKRSMSESACWTASRSRRCERLPAD